MQKWLALPLIALLHTASVDAGTVTTIPVDDAIAITDAPDWHADWPAPFLHIGLATTWDEFYVNWTADGRSESKDYAWHFVLNGSTYHASRENAQDFALLAEHAPPTDDLQIGAHSVSTTHFVIPLFEMADTMGVVRNVTLETPGATRMAPDHPHNPYNVEVGQAESKHWAAASNALTGNDETVADQLNIQEASSTFMDGRIFLSMTMEELNLTNPECDRMSWAMQINKPLGSTTVWSNLLLNQGEFGHLNLLIPMTAEGFVYTSDLHRGQSDITHAVTIDEGRPGRVSWVLDGSHWWDGLEGPQQLVASVGCDNEYHSLYEPELEEPSMYSIPLIAALAVFLAAIAMVVRRK